MMQALVTAGALVALADGRVESVERDELVSFIDRQGFAPTISQRAVADAFDNRVQQIGKRDGGDAILQAFRPLSGLSLASVVVHRRAGRCRGPQNSSRRAANSKAYPTDLDEPAGHETNSSTCRIVMRVFKITGWNPVKSQLSLMPAGFARPALPQEPADRL